MTSFASKCFNWPGVNKEKFIKDATEYLEDNVCKARQVVNDIEKVEELLEKEQGIIVEHIQERANSLKQLIDSYVDVAKSKVQEGHEVNISRLNKLKRESEERVLKLEIDIAKVKDALSQDVKIAKPLVNKVKVVEMVIKSIDKSRIKRHVDIVRPVFEAGKDVNEEFVKEIIGKLDQKDQNLVDILYPVKLLKEFKTSAEEDINTLAINEQSKEHIWMCLGAGTKLTSYKESGGKGHIAGVTDIPVDDMLITDDGRVIFTSPDSVKLHVWAPGRRLTGSASSAVLAKDSLHLHGLTVCNTSGLLSVCGTDKPNYSDEKPNETVIIEYTLYGKEVRRIMISGYTGKVYRIAQNVNNQYVLTFPKQGMVISVDSVGKIKSSFGHKDLIKCDVPLRAPTSDDNDEYGVGFWPSGIACDDMGHVLVSDWLNKTVLMMDEKLNFLRCVGTRYTGPNALLYDKKSNVLWIGDKGSAQCWKTSDFSDIS
ncbi:uncharacterized protein LOC128245786 [Mya arenaria]|uniref:uncharacterized protein LOC128245786 n=1 Tax=Mya arenaria TaxID=6604 RepID=UPI0022E84348|nr:uncharacterized protein LOC128245786 [Mya arenaria]